MQHLLKNIPLPIAGLALGVVALGNLMPAGLGIVRALCGIVALALVLLVVGRVVMFPGSVHADFRNPLLASVSATFLMTVMQLATYLAPYAFGLALVLWVAAVGAHLMLMAWFSLRFLPRRSLDDVYPTWFIAYVGIIVASVTSPVFGLAQAGYVLFWFGFALYAVLLVLVTVRCVRRPLPQPALPTLCIYGAPMSLSLTGYLSTCPSPEPVFVAVLAVSGQGLLLFACCKLPALLRLPFYPSYAAMTFPFVISATGLGKALALFSSVGYGYPVVLDLVVLAETALAAAMVVYVLVRYTVYLTGRVRDERGSRETVRASEAA